MFTNTHTTFTLHGFTLRLRAVLRIHDILGWIRIRGSMPLANWSGSCYFCHDLQNASKKLVFYTIFSAFYFLKLHLHHFSKIKSQKESQNRRNQGFLKLFLHDNRRIRIPMSMTSGSGYLWLVDPDPDPQHCLREWSERSDPDQIIRIYPNARKDACHVKQWCGPASRWCGSGSCFSLWRGSRYYLTLWCGSGSYLSIRCGSVSYHSPFFQFRPSNALRFPPFHFNADPNPAFHLDVNPDSDPASHNDANPCGSGTMMYLYCLWHTY